MPPTNESLSTGRNPKETEFDDTVVTDGYLDRKEGNGPVATEYTDKHSGDFGPKGGSDAYFSRAPGHGDGPTGEGIVIDESKFSNIRGKKGYNDRDEGNGPTGEGVKIDRSKFSNTRGTKGYNDREVGNGPDPLGEYGSESKKGGKFLIKKHPFQSLPWRLGHHNDKGELDSTLGKIMEKAGEVLKNPDLIEKGTTKREEAA